MQIIPKADEPKEPIALLGVFIVHYMFGLGIAYLGQTTKNIPEFWGGVCVFIIVVGLMIAGFLSGSEIFWGLLALFSIFTWAYILTRLIYIYVKKITKFKIL